MNGTTLRFRAKMLLLAASLLGCLCVLELAARRGFLLPYNPSADGWWEVSWLKRSAQYDSTRVSQTIDQFDPQLGWRLRENLRDVKLLEATVNSNSQGVRGVREYPLANSGHRRVVAIGDSYTFGEGVDDDQTFSAGLERLLDHSEVLNLGVHGYGTDQQWLRLQTDGLKYHPNIVLLGYYEDDIPRNRLRFRDYLKPHVSLVDGQLVLDNLPIPSPEEFKSRFHVRLLSYWNIFTTALRDRRLQAENVERSKRLLDAIVASSQSISATVVQVYLPTPDQVEANETTHPGLFSYTCGLTGVVCVDPTSAMHRWLAPYAERKKFFRYHYAPELHHVIAEELARRISAMPLDGYRR